mgnify:CR=1 FL=1
MTEKKPSGMRRNRAVAAETALPVQAVNSSLREEIDLLRGMLQKAATLSAEERSLEEWMDLLDTVSKASTRLAGLIKAQRSLESQSQADAHWSDVLAEAVNRLRAAPPASQPGGKEWKADEG